MLMSIARHYRQNRRLIKTVRKVMALGFLPTLIVRQKFILLRGSRRYNVDEYTSQTG